jgi:fucose 4-O-acetylase-like acetyltransferase
MVKEGKSTLTIILVVLVILKLTGLISWSWWIVTLPFTIPFCISAFFICLFLLVRVFSK